MPHPFMVRGTDGRLWPSFLMSSPHGPAKRSIATAVANGLRLKCPRCGRGHLFSSYLRVADRCEVCGQELFHHRADDFPPYIAIFIVGHLIVGVMLELQFHAAIEPWVYLITAVPVAIVLPLLILPTIKGAIVGLQWANRLYGFAMDRPLD